MPRTKIVATIGPSSSSEEMIQGLIEEGMNVARVNFSHLNAESATEMVARLRKVAKEMKVPLAILGDLQGPKLRLGAVPNDGILTELGDHVTLSPDGENGTIPFPHERLYEAIEPGARLVLGDGEVELHVMEREGNLIHCVAAVPGLIGSRKGVNMPGTTLPIPSITKKDRRDIVTICELKLDYVALSFVRSADDILELRDLMSDLDTKIPIIAKIEKREAIEVLEEICDVSDGMMVARGDLGIDLPAPEIPFLQKRIIEVCNQVGKPVITATQMLQSMVEHPVPTRAEASDVANAILDGSDAVMLSGETANGKYPLRAVRMMRNIALIAEKNFPYEHWNRIRLNELYNNTSGVAEAISSASCGISRVLVAKAIVINTMSGYTARQVARFRPKSPIICFSPLESTRRRLSLIWGVSTIQVPRFDTMDEIFENTAQIMIESGGFEAGDRIVMTAGTPYERTGLTNLLQVYEFSPDDFLDVAKEEVELVVELNGAH